MKKPSSSLAVSLSNRPLHAKDAFVIASVCSALSDPVRLRLFDLVRRAGAAGVCSCDLTEPLDRSQPTISHHLKVLREAGLVESRRDGTWIWYSATPEVFAVVTNYLSSVS
ncbi:MAG: metalloregulator ArsR/SmtB family transcription factor [Actinobacteria bacterium]|nr:metalloregulator ArsR/SmtB family transcription factor [Actinomycetota bacterium]